MKMLYSLEGTWQDDVNLEGTDAASASGTPAEIRQIHFIQYLIQKHAQVFLAKPVSSGPPTREGEFAVPDEHAAQFGPCHIVGPLTMFWVMRYCYVHNMKLRKSVRHSGASMFCISEGGCCMARRRRTS